MRLIEHAEEDRLRRHRIRHVVVVTVDDEPYVGRSAKALTFRADVASRQERRSQEFRERKEKLEVKITSV